VAADRAANARTPTLLTLMLNPAGGAAAVSRSCALRRPTAACIADDALGLVRCRGAAKCVVSALVLCCASWLLSCSHGPQCLIRNANARPVADALSWLCLGSPPGCNEQGAAAGPSLRPQELTQRGGLWRPRPGEALGSGAGRLGHRGHVAGLQQVRGRAHRRLHHPALPAAARGRPFQPRRARPGARREPAQRGSQRCGRRCPRQPRGTRSGRPRPRPPGAQRGAWGRAAQRPSRRKEQARRRACWA